MQPNGVMGRTLGSVLDGPAPVRTAEILFLNPSSDAHPLRGVKNFDKKNVEKSWKTADRDMFLVSPVHYSSEAGGGAARRGGGARRGGRAGARGAGGRGGR